MYFSNLVYFTWKHVVCEKLNVNRHLCLIAQVYLKNILMFPTWWSKSFFYSTKVLSLLQVS